MNAAPALYDAQMEAHSASLLSAAEFMTGLEVGYAYLRLILPLHVVGWVSPVKKQRVRARRLLKRWRGAGGLAGLCDVAIVGLRECGSGEDADEDDGGANDDDTDDGDLLMQHWNDPKHEHMPATTKETKGVVKHDAWCEKADHEKRKFGYPQCLDRPK